MAALRDSEPMPQVASPLLSLADELLLAIFEHLPAAALCSLVQVTLLGRTRAHDTHTHTHTHTRHDSKHTHTCADRGIGGGLVVGRCNSRAGGRA